MPIRIEAYTVDGILSGTVPWPGHLRDALEAGPELAVEAATFASLAGRPPGPPGNLPLVIDELVVATSDEPLPGFVHAAWHEVVIEAGPYRLEGELATLPGFDPGRALTRPSGTFVHLRDIRLSLLDRPEAGTATHPEGLVNRYLVDMVESDLMLGFFFPGARMEGPGAHSPPSPRPQPTMPSSPPQTGAAVGSEPAGAAGPATAAEPAEPTEPVEAAADGSSPDRADDDATLVGSTLAESSEPGTYPRNGSAAAPTA